ncbi:MAG TPA: hypothetical protein VK694_02875 [Verrucomicrobiae bacterium]|nr:hypothetical protein [Verrucomicrobiae bacterium]
MMEFIVLGLVPGTTIQVTFVGAAIALFGFVGLSWWSFRAMRRASSGKSRPIAQ